MKLLLAASRLNSNTNPLSGRFSFAGGWKQFPYFTQAIFGHVVVNAFILSGLYFIGFMPDPNITVALNLCVEGFPGWVVLSVSVFRVGFQLLKGSPILNNHRWQSPIHLKAQKTALRVL